MKLEIKINLFKKKMVFLFSHVYIFTFNFTCTFIDLFTLLITYFQLYFQMYSFNVLILAGLVLHNML